MLGGATDVFLRLASESALAESLDHAVPLVAGAPPATDLVVGTRPQFDTRRHPAFGGTKIAQPLTGGSVVVPPLVGGFVGALPSFDRYNARNSRHPAYASSEVVDISRVPIGAAPLPDPFYGVFPRFDQWLRHPAFGSSEIADISRAPIGAAPLPDPFYGVVPRFDQWLRHPAYQQLSRLAEPPRQTLVVSDTLRAKVVGTRPSFHLHNRRDSAHPGYRSNVFARVFSLATPRGGSMVYTFTFDPEVGGQVRYSWETDILPARNGRETRLALTPVPRETYEFDAILDDTAYNALASHLVSNQATAKLFGVALMHESLTLTQATAGSTVNVPTTGFSDWCEAGQTSLIIAPDGSYKAVVVQSKNANSIALDVNVGSVGVVGARIMPVIPCYLEDAQDLSVYVNNAGLFHLKARASYFGNSVSQWNPNGVNLTTATFSIGVTPIWTQPIVMDSDTTPRATMGGTEMIDRGGALQLNSTRTAVNWKRQIVMRVYTDADRQYAKKFAGAVFGRQKVFGLPTYRPDLIATNPDASGGTLIVSGSSGHDSVDYVNGWFTSAAHRFLMITTSTETDYVEVTDCVDNLDGTQTLQLSQGVSGVIQEVSFLELVRFDTDDVMLVYSNDDVGAIVIPCMVVQQ